MLQQAMLVMTHLAISDTLVPLQLSKVRKAKSMKLSSDQLAITSTGGYRTVQSNKGVHQGTWYFEVTVKELGETGHCRLGVGTTRQEIDGPCGYTQESFGFRDVDGSKVTEGWRHDYGKPYAAGDTVGCAHCARDTEPLGCDFCIACVSTSRTSGRDSVPAVVLVMYPATDPCSCRVYLHLPPGGATMEAKAQIVKWKGRLFQTVDEQQLKAKSLPGSALGFCINGEWQVCTLRMIQHFSIASITTQHTLAVEQCGCRISQLRTLLTNSTIPAGSRVQGLSRGHVLRSGLSVHQAQPQSARGHLIQLWP